MKPKPQISVGLVTRNRADSLVSTLESLRRQSAQPFEVIVSDDSDENKAAETEAVAGRFGCRYARGPRRGLYANRNSIARLCQGTHLRTMDDDHMFPEGHFELCEQAVASDPESFWSTGETGFIDGKFYAAVDRALELQPSGVGALAHSYDDNWAVADGSTVFPVEVFRRGCYMVEEFGFGSNYLEFGVYLYRVGFKGRSVRGAAVEHYAGFETLGRLDTPTGAESRFFASLCYNLYFKWNPWLAMKYTASHILRSRRPIRMVARFPAILAMARKRWGPLPSRPVQAGPGAGC